YPVNVSASGTGTTATFDSAQHLKSLSLGANTRATMNANGNRALYVQSLNMDAAAALDLNDNDLVVSYGTNPSVFSAVRGLVFAGYSGSPEASKKGIISGTGQTAGNTILAEIDNAYIGAADWPLASGNATDVNSGRGK